MAPESDILPLSMGLCGWALRAVVGTWSFSPGAVLLVRLGRPGVASDELVGHSAPVVVGPVPIMSIVAGSAIGRHHHIKLAELSDARSSGSLRSGSSSVSAESPATGSGEASISGVCRALGSAWANLRWCPIASGATSSRAHVRAGQPTGSPLKDAERWGRRFAAPKSRSFGIVAESGRSELGSRRSFALLATSLTTQPRGRETLQRIEGCSRLRDAGLRLWRERLASPRCGPQVLAFSCPLWSQSLQIGPSLRRSWSRKWHDVARCLPIRATLTEVAKDRSDTEIRPSLALLQQPASLSPLARLDSRATQKQMPPTSYHGTWRATPHLGRARPSEDEPVGEEMPQNRCPLAGLPRRVAAAAPVAARLDLPPSQARAIDDPRQVSAPCCSGVQQTWGPSSPTCIGFCRHALAFAHPTRHAPLAALGQVMRLLRIPSLVVDPPQRHTQLCRRRKPCRLLARSIAFGLATNSGGPVGARKYYFPPIGSQSSWFPVDQRPEWSTFMFVPSTARPCCRRVDKLS